MIGRTARASSPSAHGFDDERRTLARVQTLIRRRLRVSLSVATVWRLLKRHGWGVAAGRSLAAASGAWLVFDDEAGFSTTPPRARTWGRRGQTPVVRVRGRSRRRTSVAALCCYKPGSGAGSVRSSPLSDESYGDKFRKCWVWAAV